MFTIEQRDLVRDHIIDLARKDPRVVAGALIGSLATDANDKWSDIDIGFGITGESTPEEVLADWTDTLGRDLGVLHYWDLPSGSSIYRVFLLPSGIEVDLSVTPEKDFGAKGPGFRTLFGTTQEPKPAAKQSVRYLVGLCWHHVLHARSYLERGKWWAAEYWISALRDHTLDLMCLRFGEEASYARGVDRLPASVTGSLAGTLASSLDDAELRRALGVATECFIAELDASDPELGAQLKPVLDEYGLVRLRKNV